MTGAPLYLDYAASTPVDPAVARRLYELMSDRTLQGNPSSAHASGYAASALVERAAGQVAELVNCDPGQLVWTSGATESNNLAILGAAAYRAPRGRHVVSMRTEHRAVVDPVQELGRRGFAISWVAPQRDGRLDIGEFRAALRADTQLVSIMHVNNETGVLQDIETIGRLCRERDILFHVDAAQSFGKVPIDLASLPVDLLSATAHKIYGPKGTGVLYVAGRPGAHIDSLFFGGGQQGGRRPGTLPAALIAGFGLAGAIAARRLDADATHLTALRDRLWEGIRDLPGLARNGSASHSFPGILNVSAEGVEGESLLLDLEPLCVASGSACNSTDRTPSAVLRAMGLDDRAAQSAIRFSFGRPTTAADIDMAIDRYRHAVRRLRALAPGRAA